MGKRIGFFGKLVGKSYTVDSLGRTTKPRGIGKRWGAGSKRKRSRKKSGCYIATAVYGSYDCPQVLVLRRYRDEKLLKSKLGKLFVSLYYKCSPLIAKKLSKTKRLNFFVKKILDIIVKNLR